VDLLDLKEFHAKDSMNGEWSYSLCLSAKLAGELYSFLRLSGWARTFHFPTLGTFNFSALYEFLKSISSPSRQPHMTS
jgi:hypothetical protein